MVLVRLGTVAGGHVAATPSVPRRVADLYRRSVLRQTAHHREARAQPVNSPTSVLVLGPLTCTGTDSRSLSPAIRPTTVSPLVRVMPIAARCVLMYIWLGVACS